MLTWERWFFGTLFLHLLGQLAFSSKLGLEVRTSQTCSWLCPKSEETQTSPLTLQSLILFILKKKHTQYYQGSSTDCQGELVDYTLKILQFRRVCVKLLTVRIPNNKCLALSMCFINIGSMDAKPLIHPQKSIVLISMKY